jgi:hypothetical protein
MLVIFDTIFDVHLSFFFAPDNLCRPGLMETGIESLLWQHLPCMRLRSVWPSQQTLYILLPFGRHVEVLASENTENGLRETMRTGERETVW